MASSGEQAPWEPESSDHLGAMMGTIKGAEQTYLTHLIHTLDANIRQEHEIKVEFTAKQMLSDIHPDLSKDHLKMAIKKSRTELNEAEEARAQDMTSIHKLELAETLGRILFEEDDDGLRYFPSSTDSEAMTGDQQVLLSLLEQVTQLSQLASIKMNFLQEVKSDIQELDKVLRSLTEECVALGKRIHETEQKLTEKEQWLSSTRDTVEAEEELKEKTVQLKEICYVFQRLLAVSNVCWHKDEALVAALHKHGEGLRWTFPNKKGAK